MKLADLQGRMFQPGLITEVPTGNLLWVDAVNGNDALAVAGRMTVPFKTLTAAKLAANAATFDQNGNVTVPGDTIAVLPGIYNEKNLLKHGVNWHFMNGAVVRYEGTDPGGIFDTSVYGANGPVISTITGWGAFEMVSPYSSSLVYVVTENTRLEIRALRMSSAAYCIVIAGYLSTNTTTVRVDVLEDILGSLGGALYVDPVAANCFIRARRLLAGAMSCIEIHWAGPIEVEAEAIVADAASAIVIEGSQVKVRASEIRSPVVPVSIMQELLGDITIAGARIISESTDPAVYMDRLEFCTVRLVNCVLLVASGGTYSVDGNSLTPPIDVQCQGGCMAGLPAAASIHVIGDLNQAQGIT